MAFCRSIPSSFQSPISHLSRNKVNRTPYMAMASHGSSTTSYNLVSAPHKHSKDWLHIEHKMAVKEVERVFHEVEDPFELLYMVDALQRLGIDYHIEDDIRAVLSKQYYRSRLNAGDDNGDLYDTALSFRLLRQEGYYVSADCFKSFKDSEGDFLRNGRDDVKGLLALYEASHLGIEGESILDEANESASKYLNLSTMILKPDLAQVVRHTLTHPYHKSLARFQIKDYLKSFQGPHKWATSLQKLAKMDFNFVQSLHQREVLKIIGWWGDLGLSKELKFVRSQPLKWHMWSMTALTDPRFSEQRIQFTKPISLVYLIDDIYDVYGTLEELELFTEAVNRWELAAIEKLPEYMKISFRALYDITNEIADSIQLEHGWNPIETLRKAWGSLCNAFLLEAKWFASGHVPKADEYLKNGVVSSGVHLILVHLFFLLGERVNNQNLDILEGVPGLISCSAKILRLWDDLGSAEDEGQDGKDGSYMKCYMKEHPQSSAESAKNHIHGLISDTWKGLNAECLSPNPFSSSFIKASLNIARMVPVMYSYDDNQGLPTLHDHIRSLLYEKIPV